MTPALITHQEDRDMTDKNKNKKCPPEIEDPFATARRKLDEIIDDERRIIRGRVQKKSVVHLLTD
ncbi:MAG TPA: hypothetical protein VEH06_17780 [Candidatus Bathyarchaeia archaeon]|nr:hypothetical protein [Candidatus Bathyarchaeia archaeon]